MTYDSVISGFAEISQQKIYIYPNPAAVQVAIDLSRISSEI